MLKRNPDFVSRAVAEQMVLVPVTRQAADLESVFTLNEVGAFIWQALEEPVTEQDLARAVAEEYEVDEEQALADVEEFLVQLEEIDAVTRA